MFALTKHGIAATIAAVRVAAMVGGTANGRPPCVVISSSPVAGLHITAAYQMTWGAAAYVILGTGRRVGLRSRRARRWVQRPISVLRIPRDECRSCDLREIRVTQSRKISLLTYLLVESTGICLCFCQSNNGLKRKADTAADTSADSSSFQSVASPVSTPAVVGRQDMLPPVKRPKKELTESESHEVTMHLEFSRTVFISGQCPRKIYYTGFIHFFSLLLIFLFARQHAVHAERDIVLTILSVSPSAQCRYCD